MLHTAGAQADRGAETGPVSRLTFTVTFDDPFWVAVLEVADGGALRVARHVFGAQPTDPELAQFVRDGFPGLLARAVAPRAVAPRAVDPPDGVGLRPGPPDRPPNPKRARREARRAVTSGPSSKAQEALRRQIEERKQERRVQGRAEREAAAAHKRDVARRKAREKHRGH